MYDSNFEEEILGLFFITCYFSQCLILSSCCHFKDQEYVAGARVDKMCHNSSKYLAEADGGASKYGDFRSVCFYFSLANQ